MANYIEFKTSPVTEQDGVITMGIGAWEEGDTVDEGRVIVSLVTSRGADYINYHYWMAEADLTPAVIAAIADAEKQMKKYLKGPLSERPREERWAAVENFVPNVVFEDAEYDEAEVLEEIEEQRRSDHQALDEVKAFIQKWKDEGHVSRDTFCTLNRLHDDVANELADIITMNK